MQNAIKLEIKRLSKKALTKSQSKQRKEEEYRKKFEKRTGLKALLPGTAVTSSFPHRHFDPIYCARNANFLAKSIWWKIINYDYEPNPALTFKIPKPQGGHRQVMAFSIPDAALANVILRRTRDRNLKRLSSFSFAYHPQRNVFDAILSLSGFINHDKLFAVQIDFENFFDSIPSRYLKQCVDDKELLSLTPHERYVFEEFLNHRYVDAKSYMTGVFKRRAKGTPQGSSVSLLLANVANHELDSRLEKCPGKFVRFADDVTALCNTYEDAQKIEKAFLEHCEDSGITINEEKSPGAGAISNHQAEIRTFEYIDYLGYRISKKGLSVPDKVRKRIVDKASRLINIYLIHYPEKFGFSKNRCGTKPDYDWDLLGLVSELRNYLYGGLSEAEIGAFLTSGRELRQMRGLMGFYAILDDPTALRELDGWLANSVSRAMVKRQAILSSKYGAVGLRPTKKQLILGSWLDHKAWRGGNIPEAGLPSLVRGWRAARKYYFTFGLEKVEAPTYFAYY